MINRHKLEKAYRKIAAYYKTKKNLGKHKIHRSFVEAATPPSFAESLVIPVVGESYIEEGILAATFARKFYPQLKEVLIVTNCDESLFASAASVARVCRLDVECLVPKRHAYSQIFRSRLIKILAPLQASFDNILMTDSDLNILQPITVPFARKHLMGCFRKGKMISKVYRSGTNTTPHELKGTYRAYLWDHLNSAFLAATKETWTQLSPIWVAEYLSIWNKLPDNQPPTDQVALCSVLDKLDITTVDLGDWVNWPVAKKIGGKDSAIPAEVIGAHGGFPIAEWEKYLANQDSLLRFMSPEEMGLCRYLNDADRDNNGNT